MTYAKALGLIAGALLVISGAFHVAMVGMLQGEVGFDALAPTFVLGVLFLVSGGALLWRTQRWTCSMGITSAAICVALSIALMVTGMMAAMMLTYPILALFQMPMFMLMGPVNIAIIALAAVSLRGIGK